MKKTLAKSQSLSNEFQEYFSLQSDEDDKGVDDEVLEFYSSTNKLIEREIEAMKLNLQEAEQDIVTLRSNRTEAPNFDLKDSVDVDLENIDTSEIKWFSTTDKDIEEQAQEDEEEHLLRKLKAISRDIRYTKNEMLCVKEEEEYYKNHIDILNEVFLYLLEPKSGKGTDTCKQFIDFERAFTDSLKLSNELNFETTNVPRSSNIDRKDRKTKKVVRARQHRYGMPGSNSLGLFSVEQVERILKTLKREKKYLDENNMEVWSKILEKLLIELLQKYDDKAVCNQNQEKKRKSLIKRLRYLEKFCCPNGSNENQVDESQTNSEVFDPYLARTKASLDVDEEVSIDFEQPISLINPNYIPPSDQI